MLAQQISRRSFLSITAMAGAAMALDWNRMEALASGMGPKEDYPTVVIGAGLGGALLRSLSGKTGNSRDRSRKARHPRRICNGI